MRGPSSASEAIVQSIDLHPTLLEMAGLRPQPGRRFDGGYFPHYTPGCQQHPGHSGPQRRLKLRRVWCDSLNHADRYEFYNLIDDIGETRDLSARYPVGVRELAGLISRRCRSRILRIGPRPRSQNFDFGGIMISRRTFLAAAAASKVRPPNVLFICSDQHQTRAAGCYGSHEVATPNIDSIAASGTRFNRAYCQSPVCVPARGSIVTGLYPHRHGARILQDALRDDVPTAGHFFKERGYVTGAIGKMHFVDESRRHGFDHRLNEASFLETLTDEDRKKLRGDQGGAESFAGKASPLPDRYFQDYWFAGESVKFLRENRNRPFCLWTSFFMPHTPLSPQARYFQAYAAKRLTLPKRSDHELTSGFPGHLIRARERGWYDQTDEQVRQSLCGYYGNVTQMDACVGRVYDALRELGLDRNTVVVYTSDHGEMAGAHRMWTKHNMYEQSVNVPLVISYSGAIGVNALASQMVEHVDLFPTLAELCGFEAPRGTDGRSLAPLLRGKRYTARELAYSEYYFCRNVFTRDDRYVGKPPILMVRTGKWKFNYLSWDRCELFDLERDPGEFENRVDDTGNAGVVRELRGTAERLFASRS